MINIAVIGSGRMSHVRTKAFLSASNACKVCCVASRSLVRAKIFAKEYGCDNFADNYKEVINFCPDFVLIEVPHSIQDEISLWGVQLGFNLLIGGCLATSVSTGMKIMEKVAQKNLIVETGYEARYKEVWKCTKKYINDCKIGDIIAIRSIALFNANPNSWYYDEISSGGMILTHMTYAFINPIRWIFGIPTSISVVSNRKVETGNKKVLHETCSANFMFKGNILCNMIAGYVKPNKFNAWELTIIGSNGVLEISPGDMEAGSLKLYSNNTNEIKKAFSKHKCAFQEQAKAYLSDLEGGKIVNCLNPPVDSIEDLKIAEAIAHSANENNH